MSDWLSSIKRALMGGPLDQLPAGPEGVRPGFGLGGAGVQSSDFEDQLRNADVKQAAMPDTPGGARGLGKLLTPRTGADGIPVFSAKLSGRDVGALRAGRKRGIEVNNDIYTVTRVSPEEYAKADLDPNYAPQESVFARIEAPSESHANSVLRRLREAHGDDSLQFSEDFATSHSPLDAAIDVPATVIGTEVKGQRQASRIGQRLLK